MKASAFEWHAEREQQLFALHRQHGSQRYMQGNKWTAIAEHLGIDDNAVKNKFYSTLRRGLRRLNRYITEVKRKLTPTHLAANKYIKDELLVKVNAVADRTSEEKYNEKYEVKQPAIAVSKGNFQHMQRFNRHSLNWQESTLHTNTTKASWFSSSSFWTGFINSIATASAGRESESWRIKITTKSLSPIGMKWGMNN